MSSPSGRNVQKARSRLAYLGVFLLLEIALLAYLAPKDPLLMRSLKLTVTARRGIGLDEQVRERMRSDPDLGTRVLPSDSTLLTQDTQGYPAEQRTVLVLVGQCAPCVDKDLRQWAEVAAERPGRRLVVISRDTEANIRAYLRSSKARLRVVSDPQGRLTRALNAFWSPRAYSVDAKGSLAWIQRDNRASPANMAGEAWADGGGREW